VSRPMAQYVWDLPNKSGWVHAKLCHYQGLMRPRQIGEIRGHVYSSDADARMLRRSGLLNKEGATGR
jgi:hypothetical protein